MISANGTIDPNKSAGVYAREYWDAGLSVLPIARDGSKKPHRGLKWGNLQKQKATEQELNEMFKLHNCGVAIACGEGSGNVECMDFDKDEFFAPVASLVEKECAGLIARLTQHKTPNGRHLFYRCSEIAGNTKLAMVPDDDGVLEVAIETRGRGGYALVPGCPEECHPSRRLYEHVAGPSLCEVATITPEERQILWRCARAFDQSPIEDMPAPASNAPRQSDGTSPGDAFNEQADWHAILTPHGWRVAHTGADKTFWRRPGKTIGWSATTGIKSTKGNELFCCFSTNASPFEGGDPCKSYSKFACYALLNHAGNYADAARALANANYGERSTKSASTSTPQANGQQHHEPTKAATVAEKQPPAIVYTALTMAELDSAEYAIEYLVEGTLVAKQPCMVSGGKKMLKTSLLVDLFLSLATAGKFLGRLRVERRVMSAMFSGESGLATLQETFRRVARAKGYSLADIRGVLLSADLPKFGDIGHMDAVRDFIRTNAIEVVGIDPAYLCMPGGDAGNLFIQGEMLRAMSEVCQQEGCTLVLAHHDKKGIIDPYQPPELENIAWAGFQEFARQWILVGRRERYEPGTGEHRLWLNCGGSAGHSSLWALDVLEGAYDGKSERQWEVELIPAATARDDADSRKIAAANQKFAKQIEADMRTITQKMAGKSLAGGASKSRIQEDSLLNSRRFKPAFAKLLESGSVIEIDIVVSNHKTPKTGYKLAETTQC